MIRHYPHPPPPLIPSGEIVLHYRLATEPSHDRIDDFRGSARRRALPQGETDNQNQAGPAPHSSYTPGTAMWVRQRRRSQRRNDSDNGVVEIGKLLALLDDGATRSPADPAGRENSHHHAQNRSVMSKVVCRKLRLKSAPPAKVESRPACPQSRASCSWACAAGPSCPTDGPRPQRLHPHNDEGRSQCPDHPGSLPQRDFRSALRDGRRACSGSVL